MSVILRKLYFACVHCTYIYNLYIYDGGDHLKVEGEKARNSRHAHERHETSVQNVNFTVEKESSSFHVNQFLRRAALRNPQTKRTFELDAYFYEPILKTKFYKSREKQVTSENMNLCKQKDTERKTQSLSQRSFASNKKNH